MSIKNPRFFRAILPFILLAGTSLLFPGSINEKPRPPKAEKKPVELSAHGQTRTDDFYWLNERENPAVRAYLEAENAYASAVTAHTEELQEKLYREIVGRIRQDDVSVPYYLNGYHYYTRFSEGQEYPVYCRRKGSMQAAEEIMLDVNELAAGHSFFHVADLQVSPDNRLLAFAQDTVSRRLYTIRFKDLQSGGILPGEISNTSGQIMWAADSKTVFYVTRDETLRPCRVYRHELGRQQETDQLVFAEKDETFNVYLSPAKSRRFLLINSVSTLSSEVRFIPADQPRAEFRIFQPRQKDLLYEVDHGPAGFLVLTNWQARNFRLMAADERSTAMSGWREIIPHREDVLLEQFEIFTRRLVLNERKKGLHSLRIIGLEAEEDYNLDLGEETYIARIGFNPELDRDSFRFHYSSLTTPHSIYEYDFSRRSRKLLKMEEVLGNFDPADYQSRRIQALASDGREIPISLVFRRELLTPESGNPLLLYGYGSYGYSSDPYFNSPILSLLDRGFIFAIAHIRGGQEMGRFWYEEGKLLNKKNTFTDFIACAEHLIKEGYTDHERIFAMGGSAGGLLVGAVINARPELFNAVIAQVPFVDVITTMFDESIPLTTSEYDEWGNPNDPVYHDYMLSYSPYDQVRELPYPAMLVTAGFHDSQVQYWEPAKWVAKMRILGRHRGPLLLKTNMEAGHGGASGRFQRYRETAFEYAFLLDRLAGGD